MQDIPGYDGWRTVCPLDGGFSRDEKFRVVDETGRQMLLILSDGAFAGEKEREFFLLRLLKQTDPALPVPDAFDCGKCEDGFYQLLSWQQGVPLDTVENGDLACVGRESGKILKRIHDASRKLNVLKWFREYDLQKLLERKIRLYNDSGLEIRDDGEIMEFLLSGVSEHRHEPIILLHGDFHLKNIVMDENGTVSVIDFNRMKPGPAALDFARLEICSRPLNADFCNAMYEGYCGGKPDGEFLQAVNFYTVFEAFFNVQWQTAYGGEAVAAASKTLRRVWRQCLER